MGNKGESRGKTCSKGLQAGTVPTATVEDSHGMGRALPSELPGNPGNYFEHEGNEETF